MTRKLAITHLYEYKKQVAKIKLAAPDFELVFGEDVSDCEIVFGHMGPQQIQTAMKLKWFHAQSAGVDQYILPDWGLPESVVLTNSAGMHGISIAEHLLAFTLMLMRNMHSYVLQQPRHEWKGISGVKSIYGSLVTVVGLGGIGRRYATYCKALGATVRGVVRNPRHENCVDEMYTASQLDEAIADADVVALVLPNTVETAGLFNRERMLKLKKGALILNAGRGSAIDQDALIELLESGHLGGAGLDVTTPEPLPKESRLWDLPNVIVTPHVSRGASLDITTEMIFDRFVGYLEDYVAGREFVKVVDRKLGY